MNRRHFFLWTLTLGLTLGKTIAAFTPDSLEGEVALYLHGGQEFRGTIIGSNEEGVALRILQDEGELSIEFPSARIETISFPGEEAFALAAAAAEREDWAEAMRIYDHLFLQRSSYFRFLPPENIRQLLPVVEASLQAGDPARAIARAERLTRHLHDEVLRNYLADQSLLGFYRIGLLYRAEALAQEWVNQRGAFGDSSLGWHILASIRFRDGDVEEALWLLLHPLVYRGSLDTHWNHHNLILGIAAAQLLGDERQRDHLIADLFDRGLDWIELPEIRLHPDLREWERPRLPETAETIPETPQPEWERLPDLRDTVESPEEAHQPLPGEWMPRIRTLP